MSSARPSFAIPKRHSLSGQAADTLRAGLADGTWKDFLPSERRLCEMFQVSRPTIRTALHLLVKDGLVETRPGRRNRVLSTAQESLRCPSRLVGLITTQPVSQMTIVAYKRVSEMRTHLAEQGFATELLVCAAGKAAPVMHKLEEFARQNRMYCCVLFSVSKEIQQWFSARPVPALVLGSCHPGVKLPSIDIDQRSVCRHAAGIFLSRGHRRLALVVPDNGIAGDLASEQGFHEAVDQHAKSDGVQSTVVHHDGTARNIGAKLDLLFSSSTPPTALLVAKPQDVFIVLIYLLKRGLSVPNQISVIARDHDPIFEIVDPPIAHYSLEEDAYVHRLSRLMDQLAAQAYPSTEPNLIFPKFFTGGTVTTLK